MFWFPVVIFSIIFIHRGIGLLLWCWLVVVAFIIVMAIMVILYLSSSWHLSSWRSLS